MGEVRLIGLDIAKELFQVYGVDRNGNEVFICAVIIES